MILRISAVSFNRPFQRPEFDQVLWLPRVHLQLLPETQVLQNQTSSAVQNAPYHAVKPLPKKVHKRLVFFSIKSGDYVDLTWRKKLPSRVTSGPQWTQVLPLSGYWSWVKSPMGHHPTAAVGEWSPLCCWSLLCAKNHQHFLFPPMA